MGGGDNELIIKTALDAIGFEKGSKRLARAVGSLSKQVQDIGRQTQRSLGSITGIVKRITPMLLGVGSAYGVISKAVNAFLSENQQLASKMNSIWTALGNILGPIITQVINWITTAVSYFIEFLRLLGITSKTASQASKSAKGAGAELQRTLAGFDELNVLSSGGGGGGGGAGLDDPDPQAWMEELAAFIKNKMWDEAADIIIQKMNAVIAAFKEKAIELGDVIGEYLGGIVHIIARVINEVNWNQIGEALAEFFNRAFKNVNGEDLGAILVAKITIAFRIVTGFLETMDWAHFAQTLSGMVIGAFNSISAAIESADFKTIGDGIRKFFENIDWEGIQNAIFGALESAWNGALDLLWGVMAGDDGAEPPLVASLRGIVESIEELVTAIENSLKPVWDDVLKPILTWTVNSALPDFFERLADRLKDLADLLNGKISFKEFISDMSGVEVAIAGVTTVMGALDFGKFIADVQNLASSSVLGKLAEVFALTAEGAGTFGEAVTTVFPNLGKAFSGLQTIATGVGSAFSKLWAIIAANPIIAVIAVVAALVAAFIHAYQTNEEFREKVDAAWQAVKDFISSAVEVINQKIQSFKDFFNSLRDAISTGAETIGAKISSIKQWFTDLGPNIRNTFTDLVSRARTWGADMIQNFINGLGDRIQNLWDSMKNIAQGIRNFIGFSEPKEGPLSNFHTFAPDMIDLYARGINDNKSKVLTAVSELAGGISDALQDGDYTMQIDTSNIMPTMPADIPFAMPAVAGGGVTPYSVTDAFAMGQNEDSDAELLAAIEALSELIRELRESLENMEWVAQFGDIRALVKQITRIQKQIQRAEG